MLYRLKEWLRSVSPLRGPAGQMGPPGPPGPPGRDAGNYLGDLQRLKVDPGDVFVLTCEGTISDEDTHRMKQTLKENFPGHKYLVLGGGLTLCVVAGTVPDGSHGDHD